MNKYQWRLKGLAKGIDPDKAVKELERIESIYGSLTPENIVNESRKKTAVLHKLFEWDDDKAGELWRIQQARVILNNVQVSILSDGEEREIDVFETVKRDDDNVYKSIAHFDSDDILQIKVRIVRDLNQLKNKLSFYKQFEVATQKIQDAIEFLGR